MSATAREVASNTYSTAQAIESANSQIAVAQKEVNLAIDGIGELVNEVNQTSAAVGDLSQQAAKITQVLKVIGDIAEQTNLLALNAAIEAARAGEQGAALLWWPMKYAHWRVVLKIALKRLVKCSMRCTKGSVKRCRA